MGWTHQLDVALLGLVSYFMAPAGCPSQAVHLLSISKQFEKAVQLCAEHDVQITEEMAERMTPEKCRGNGMVGMVMIQNEFTQEQLFSWEERMTIKSFPKLYGELSW